MVKNPLALRRGLLPPPPKKRWSGSKWPVRRVARADSSAVGPSGYRQRPLLSRLGAAGDTSTTSTLHDTRHRAYTCAHL